MAASVKVGRYSLMVMSLGRSSSSLETEEWWEEAGNSLDRLTDI